MNPQLGKILIALGLLILLIGLMLYFFSDKLQWLGKLPGDFNWDKGKVKVYFPLATMLIISILLNMVWYLIKKLF